MRVALCFQHEGLNSRYQCPLWHEAVRNIGWELSAIEEAEIAIMWGPQPELSACLATGRPAIVLDFPYWRRAWKDRDGSEFYKVSLNGQHPTPYVMKENLAAKRYEETCGAVWKPWRPGTNILLTGIGNKAARQHGYKNQEWEYSVIERLRKITDRPIVYRPKPNNFNHMPIPGTIFDSGGTLADVMRDAHCIITHHGNTAIDGYFEGIPAFMNGEIGVGSHLACLDLAFVNTPYYPENRAQFFHNLAHWQWSVEEIVEGKPLLSMRERGLI